MTSVASRSRTGRRRSGAANAASADPPLLALNSSQPSPSQAAGSGCPELELVWGRSRRAVCGGVVRRGCLESQLREQDTLVVGELEYEGPKVVGGELVAHADRG